MSKPGLDEPTEWMDRVGFSRVQRRGPLVVVSGCVPLGDDGAVVPGDAYVKALRCFAVIEAALEHVGASLSDVVRTRIHLQDVADFEAVGRAHSEVFDAVRPVTTIVGAQLVGPDYVLEVDATAWVEGA